MRDNDVELISRNTYRRMSRRKCARAWTSIKIILLWLFCLIAVTAFIIAMESVLPYRIVLKWILIFSFTYTLVWQIDSVTQKLKKSPRNGHSDRGHMEK